MSLIPLLLATILYLVNMILSFSISIIIIDKLYISKKFSKEKNFHFYNDLFSWEMFFIFIGIENVLKILSLFISTNNGILNLFIRIRILILFFPFWNKIIHLEKVMNKITYERHYFAGIIPFFIVLVLGFTSLTNFSLIIIFACSTFIPFLFFFTFLKNTGTSRNLVIKIISGAISIVIGFILRPEMIKELVGYLNTSLDYMNIVAPILTIMGILLIFDSFRKEIFN
ncbi:hypothetical protein LCGC14_1020240 [marine sediment metagenome]|uniref:Uncharacterized protein n=1 Tax=marine sediment metagenome TaxID=412755 RepID=A0A0F9R3K2_9ZZZZ|nr:hypothetical protein [bacterium]